MHIYCLKNWDAVTNSSFKRSRRNVHIISKKVFFCKPMFIRNDFPRISIVQPFYMVIAY